MCILEFCNCLWTTKIIISTCPGCQRHTSDKSGIAYSHPQVNFFLWQVPLQHAHSCLVRDCSDVQQLICQRLWDVRACPIRIIQDLAWKSKIFNFNERQLFVIAGTMDNTIDLFFSLYKICKLLDFTKFCNILTPWS